jgi:hypothetical protein
VRAARRRYQCGGRRVPRNFGNLLVSHVVTRLSLWSILRGVAAIANLDSSTAFRRQCPFVTNHSIRRRGSLTLRTVFRLALRQTEGLIASIIALAAFSR